MSYKRGEYHIKGCPRCKEYKGAIVIFAGLTHTDFRCTHCEMEFCIREDKMYIIIRDPKSGNHPYFQSERKVYDSLDQAVAVAKKLAIEHPGLKFYIAKLIKSAITEPSVSVEDV